MRIGILSDNHDELVRTKLAIDMLRTAGAEALIHCGDLTSPAIVELLSLLPSWFVFGNHDADAVPHLKEAATKHGVICLGWNGTIDLVGKRIGVAHGHMTTDIRAVLGTQPDYLLTGHSHLSLVADALPGTVRRITPGALHQADSYTVAMLDLGSEEVCLMRVVE